MAAQTKTAPSFPSAPPAPPAPPMQAEATEKPKKEKKPRTTYQEVFESAEAAEKAAGERTKGPRKAFKVTDDKGKVHFVVHNNEGRAGGVVSMLNGYKIEGIGVKARAPKALNAGSIMDAIALLPEAERAAVMAQIKALAGK